MAAVAASQTHTIELGDYKDQGDNTRVPIGDATQKKQWCANLLKHTVRRPKVETT